MLMFVYVYVCDVYIILSESLLFVFCVGVLVCVFVCVIESILSSSACVCG